MGFKSSGSTTSKFNFGFSISCVITSTCFSDLNVEQPENISNTTTNNKHDTTTLIILLPHLVHP